MEQLFSIRVMVPDCGVSPDERHVTNLTFASVKKGIIIHPAICISALLPGMARKNEHQRVVFGRRNPTLLLAPVHAVDVRRSRTGRPLNKHMSLTLESFFILNRSGFAGGSNS